MRLQHHRPRARDTDAPATPRQMMVFVRRIDAEVRYKIGKPIDPSGKPIDSANAAVLADALETYGHKFPAISLRSFNRENLAKPFYGTIDIREALNEWRRIRGHIIDAIRNLREPAARLKRHRRAYRFHRREGFGKKESREIATEQQGLKIIGHLGDPRWGLEGAKEGGPILRTGPNRYVMHWMVPFTPGTYQDGVTIFYVPLGKEAAIDAQPFTAEEFRTAANYDRASSDPILIGRGTGVLHKWWTNSDPLLRAKARQVLAKYFGWARVTPSRDSYTLQDIRYKYRRK